MLFADEVNATLAPVYAKGCPDPQKSNRVVTVPRWKEGTAGTVIEIGPLVAVAMASSAVRTNADRMS